MQDLEEMPPMDKPRSRSRSGRAAGSLEDSEGIHDLSHAKLRAQRKSVRRGSEDFEETGRAYRESLQGE